jgi:signal transduction histidine kinase
MAWAIALTHNPFQQARLQLTVFYIMSMVVIIGLFSIVLITILEKNIQDSFDDITGGNPVHHEALNKTKDGIEMIVLTIDGIVLFVVGGVGYFLAGRTLRPIQESLDRQKRFTMDASHDLRTPLTIMKTEIEVALQNKNMNPEGYKKTLVSGLEEIQTMSQLVEDLLTLARNENKTNVIEKTQVNYTQLVKKLISRIQNQAEEKSITLKVDITSTSIINVYESSFTRALENVIQNALHHTKKGGTISVALMEVGKHSKLVIEDTGVGIHYKDLPYIFDRFYKASHSRNDKAGSGLGLSIAKEIIESFGGTISLTSIEGKGTVVSILMMS